MNLYQILPNQLYQSGIPLDFKAIKEAGIGVIVDLEGSIDVGIHDEFIYIKFSIQDAELNWEMIKWFEPTLTILANSVVNLMTTGYSVLTHCAAGINRASLFNGMVLLLSYHRHVVDFIRQRRPGALTNQSFVNLLNKYEKRLEANDS